MAKDKNTEVKLPSAEEIISLYKSEVGNNMNAMRVVSFYMDEKCETQVKFADIIKLYLDCKAILDETFKKYYEKKEKSLDRCTAYIFAEMRKKAENNVAVGSPKQVFGLATHYYEEDDLPIDKAKPETVKAINEKAEKATSAGPSMIEMEQKQNAETAEFDLFDL